MSKRAFIAFTVVVGSVVGFVGGANHWSDSTELTAVAITACVGTAIVIAIDEVLDRR